ncbi:MAG: helix-turn-helix domain-containing protein [Lachnospiraceae bacterium]|nr:helix-turn-helix domain-containing protein [Lachnospiraceae bacterium]
MIDVLERITSYRQKKGWTEYQLAERSGLTQSTISSWYRKNIVPTIPSLEKVCTALGITLSQFFATDEDSFSLTDTQKELLQEAARLTEQQQKSLIDFFRTL